MPEGDKKLVAHMQTTAERELRAKKTHLGGSQGGGDDGAKRGGGGKGGSDGGITKAVRTFDTMMEGKCILYAFVFFAGIGVTVIGRFCGMISVFCIKLARWCCLKLYVWQS